jgi:endonuclease YncB( thermonuclease family)
MVGAGQAVAYGAYQAEEREAREARRGVWASTFEHPAVWRGRHPR